MGGGQKEGPSLGDMLFLSLFGHLVLISLFLFYPVKSTPKWTFGPVYTVQLVGTITLPTERKGEAEGLGMLTSRGEGLSTVLKKEPIDTLPSVPIYALERVKKKTPELEEVMESLKKRVGERPLPSSLETAKPKPLNPPQTASSPQSGYGGGETNVNGKMADYYSRIWARIKVLWSLPAGILPQENLEAIIHVQIQRDGTAAQIDFEKRSGNAHFDSSVLRAVKKALPFPPLPEGFKENTLDIGIRFHSAEFRRDTVR